MSCAAICINPVTDNLEFPDWSAFLQWKEREETETFTCYAKPNGNKEGKNEGKMLHKYSVHVLACKTTTEIETTVLYTCCRDGRAKENHYPKKSSQIRKDHGSRKLEEYCLSRITEATRASFITRQDARNIVRMLDNIVKHRHNNDAVSLDRLCRELENEEDSPIIAYKPQGRVEEKYPGLSEESFLLVIMTKFQASMFQKHSPKIVCVDSTHKTNPYGFKLVTVVVPDEFKNGKKLFEMVFA